MDLLNLRYNQCGERLTDRQNEVQQVLKQLEEFNEQHSRASTWLDGQSGELERTKYATASLKEVKTQQATIRV